LIVQTGAGTGDVGLVTEQEEGYNCHALIILQSDETLLIGSYLSLLLQSEYGKSKLESVQTGAMHPHLNCGEVKFLFTPLPPLPEQTNIVAFLDQETAKIDNLIQQAQKATTLLQERRTALISAAVTGKIDVRNKSLPASL
jgi:type I restriction enzyme S subunit